MATNRIKSLIERRLLTPSYVVMLAGLLIRSVALVLSVAIPYGTWPVWLRILVEGFAALGMIGCADIVLSAAAASGAALDRQISAALNSADYLPNPRLSGERYQREKQRLDGRRELVIRGLKDERKKEQTAVYFMAGVTVSYGILFGLTVLSNANFVVVAVEIIGVATIPFVTWYISAQYKEETTDPEQSAKTLALESVDKRLTASKERLGAGEETAADLDILGVATAGSPYHHKLVQALRRPDTTVAYVSTPEIYRLFGVTGSSQQATIRRIVRKAGELRKHGVMADSQTGEWRTPKSALIEMFPQFIGQARVTDAAGESPRTVVTRERTSQRTERAPDAVLSGQGSDSARAPLEARSDASRAARGLGMAVMAEPLRA